MVPLAPLPLGRAFVASFFPAGAKALFFYPLSGSGAVAESSPICTNRLFETGQLRRKRHGSAGRGAQPETARQVIAQCSHRAASFFFSSTGRGAFSFFKKRMGGAFPAPKRCPSYAGNGAGAFQKGTHSPRRKRRDLPAPARSAGASRQRHRRRHFARKRIFSALVSGADLKFQSLRGSQICKIKSSSREPGSTT